MFFFIDEYRYSDSDQHRCGNHNRDQSNISNTNVSLSRHVRLKFVIDFITAAMVYQPFLRGPYRRVDTLVVRACFGKHTAKLNEPTFPPGDIDKAVHSRGKIRTDRNIGGKHVIVAQDFVERRGIETGQYGFT